VKELSVIFADLFRVVFILIHCICCKGRNPLGELVGN